MENELTNFDLVEQLNQSYKSELSPKEKENIVFRTFPEKCLENTIQSLGHFLQESFKKIDNFDYRWNSLITSSPLLFEDTDYLRVKPYILSEITDDEVAAYKRGELRKLYPTFENMLIDNLDYYDRIMSYCTMVFLRYVRLSNDEIVKTKLDKIITHIAATPTQIWCAAMCNDTSTRYEIEYGWNIKLNNPDLVPIIGKNWDQLYADENFNKFVKYCDLRNQHLAAPELRNFRYIFNNEKTPNDKLAFVCGKFTKTGTAFSTEQLGTISNFCKDTEKITKKIYRELFDIMMVCFANDKSQFNIYVYQNQIIIHTTKFYVKYLKFYDTSDKKIKLSKIYDANPAECFVAEQIMCKASRILIEWVNYELPEKYNYEIDLLKTLVRNMLENKNYKNIVCVKPISFDEDNIIYSVGKFHGRFDNIVLYEKFESEDARKVCGENASRKTFGLDNMVDYLLERGYYLFGSEADLMKAIDIRDQHSIRNHYSNFCISVRSYMSNIHMLYKHHMNDVIQILVDGKIDRSRLKNANIRYTNLRSKVNPKELLRRPKLKKLQKTSGISYYKIITK